MQLITADQAMLLDELAIKEHGIMGRTLMGNAGKAIAKSVKKFVAEIHEPRITIICGKGNNGGDGFAAALHLKPYNAKILSIVPFSDIAGDALYYLKLCQRENMDIKYSKIPPDKHECDLIIDCILGIGCKGELRGYIAKWTRWINRQTAKIISVDTPTGVNGNNGFAAQESIHAALTVTMGFGKVGNFIKKGQDHTGKLEVVDIGFPDIVHTLPGLNWNQFEPDSLLSILTTIETDTQKHRQGKVLLVVGSKGMTGAAILATYGALRSGAGLTITCAPQSIEHIYEKTIIEGMSLGCVDHGKGYLIPESYNQIKEKMEWCDAMVIGPGLGQNKETLKLLRKLIINAEKPMIIDADGLVVFHDQLDLFQKINPNFVITPHEGEFCKLMKINHHQFINGFPATIEKFLKKFPGVLVLKNAPSITFYQQQAVLNCSGNPGMATAGMGDVLAGIIGTFLAQGIDPFLATQAAVYIHGLAADRQSRQKGLRGLIAGDVLNELPHVFHELGQ